MAISTGRLDAVADRRWATRLQTHSQSAVKRSQTTDRKACHDEPRVRGCHPAAVGSHQCGPTIGDLRGAAQVNGGPFSDPSPRTRRPERPQRRLHPPRRRPRPHLEALAPLTTTSSTGASGSGVTCTGTNVGARAAASAVSLRHQYQNVQMGMRCRRGSARPIRRSAATGPQARHPHRRACLRHRDPPARRITRNLTLPQHGVCRTLTVTLTSRGSADTKPPSKC
jgi:hypothetical protein